MAGRAETGIPIVLPAVRIQVGADGGLTVTIDKDPYDVPLGFARDQVPGLLQDLASDLGPIRVEITEANGEKYIDIQTPNDHNPAPLRPSPTQPPTHGIRGQFDSGEHVMVAVVVARRTAGSDGTVAVRLPPSLLQRYGDGVLLIGQTGNTPAIFVDDRQGVGS